VWFDSGSSHLAVLTKENDLPWPSDLYLEGGDQYRGWFHSSLLVGVGVRGGFALPQLRLQRLGAGRRRPGHAQVAGQRNRAGEDYQALRRRVLRLWVASVEFYEDVRMSETILTRLSEAYRKLRNTFRYALGNLFDFDPATDAVAGGDMLEIDQWILGRAEGSCAAR